MKKLIIASIIAPIIGLAMAGVHIWFLYTKTYDGPPTNFKIASGETFAHINYRLAEQKLISNPRIFHYLNRYKGSMNKYRAGVFEIPSHANMETIYEILINGAPMTNNVTIPEGKNMFEIGKILEGTGMVNYKDFISLCRDEKLLQELGVPKPSVEGYLYPETYKFAPDVDAKSIIKHLVSEFKRKTENLDFSKSTLTPHEVVILASVVEKETGARKERPMIAGVFHNRLRKKMRLQSDPTCIYGIYENYTGNIKRSDLLNKTDYNTYTIEGLPIGPIANPGIESIKAVLNPSKHEYLYFVSNNDGTHTFSETYEIHNFHVQNLQKNREARKGKSWRDLKENQ